MDPSLINSLPNLGVGVVAVLSFVYVTREFVKELGEREKAMRELEKEIRTSIMEQLAENTAIMKQLVSILNIRR